MSPLYVLSTARSHEIGSIWNVCPQVFDNYAVTVMIGDDPYTLGLFDTAGTFFAFGLSMRSPCEPSILKSSLNCVCRSGGL